MKKLLIYSKAAGAPACVNQLFINLWYKKKNTESHDSRYLVFVLVY